jgi:hypothetical protein
MLSGEQELPAKNFRYFMGRKEGFYHGAANYTNINLMGVR